MKDTVSVVIPAYNRADLIEPTLQSVLGQTHAPAEVIVVDDGSTDATGETCAKWPVRYVYQENQGLPAARNTGIRHSTSDWIAFVDSDDIWYPNKLEVQLAAHRATSAEWSCTAFGLIDPDGRKVASRGSGFEDAFAILQELGRRAEDHFAEWLPRIDIDVDGAQIPIYHGDAYAMLFSGNVVLPSTSMVSRRLIDRTGPFDASFRWAEDTEFFHRISAKGMGAFVLTPLADYRVGHASMIAAKDVSPFIRYAIDSLDRAATLRALTPGERAAYVAGRERLRLRLAYNRLSYLDGAGARKAVLDAWSEGLAFTPRAAAILLASLLPPVVLRALHRAKRAVST